MNARKKKYGRNIVIGFLIAIFGVAGIELMQNWEFEGNIFRQDSDTSQQQNSNNSGESTQSGSEALSEGSESSEILSNNSSSSASSSSLSSNVGNTNSQNSASSKNNTDIEQRGSSIEQLLKNINQNIIDITPPKKQEEEKNAEKPSGTISGEVELTKTLPENGSGNSGNSDTNNSPTSGSQTLAENRDIFSQPGLQSEVAGNSLIAQALRYIEAQLLFIPDPIKQEIYGLVSGVKIQRSGEYAIVTKGNIYLYISGKRGAINHVVLLIPGQITPKQGGLWSVLEGSRLEDLIVYAVPVGKDKSDVSYTRFPGKLSEIVRDSYVGSIDLKAGLHALARLEIHGLLGEVVTTMNYPTDNLIANIGQEYPGANGATGINAVIENSKKKGSASEALKPTHYIEITKIGDWVNPAGMNGMTLGSSTVYYDDGNNFGFWGVGNFENTPFVTYYKGPLVKAKDPKNYLEAQIGFGAENMTLGLYMKLMAAYNSRIPESKYLFAGDITSAKKASLDTLFTGIDSLPLDIVKIKNPKLVGYNFKSGDKFPGINKFNLVGLGPLATSKDGTPGPLIKLSGDAQVLGETFGTMNLLISDTRALGKTKGSLAINLGSIAEFDLGSLGGDIELDIDVSGSSQSMRLSGGFQAGFFGGQSLSINLKQNAFDFSTLASCAMPFNVNASSSVSNLANLKASDIIFIPKGAIPDPTELLSCPEDIYFILKNGALMAFNQGVKIAEFAEGLLPENEVSKAGLEGLKFAGGVAFAAPEEIAELAKQVPGVGELTELKGYLEDQAKKAAAKAAKEAVAAAKKAAEETAKAAKKAAEKAAKAAQQALNTSIGLADDLTSGAASSIIEGVGGVVSGVGGTVGGWFSSGGGGPPGFGWRLESQISAKEIGVGHDNTVWVIDKDGYPWRKASSTYKFSKIAGGMPAGTTFVRIDTSNKGEPIAISHKAEIYYLKQVTRSSWGISYTALTWFKAPGYAIDVGIGGGYIWAVGVNKVSGGYGVYRATYPATNGNFAWQRMPGGMVKIDVGGDGRAWGIDENYKVYEYDNGWHDRNGFALDLTVSENNRVWVNSAANYHEFKGGGQIYTYERAGQTYIISGWVPHAAGWAITDGFGISIGAGIAPNVWTVNTAQRAYQGTGR